MTRPLTILGLAGALMAVPLLDGCVDPARNPLAAASGAAKLQAVDESQGLGALASVIANDLTTEELASLVNLGLGKAWSLDDAKAIMDLMGQINDSNAAALENAGIDDTNATDEQIQQAFADAGIEATDQQIDLLQDLFNAVQGAGG